MQRLLAARSKPLLAGGKALAAQGLGRSGNAAGPLHDLPDWEYVDAEAEGEPPVSRRRRLWQHRRERLSAEIARMRAEEDGSEAAADAPAEGK